MKTNTFGLLLAMLLLSAIFLSGISAVSNFSAAVKNAPLSRLESLNVLNGGAGILVPDDSAAGGSRLKAAVGDENGDTDPDADYGDILILDGVYTLTETITVKRDLTIICAADSSADIRLGAAFTGRHLVITGNDVEVSIDGVLGYGITFSGHNAPETETAGKKSGGGVKIENGASLDIKKCRITGCYANNSGDRNGAAVFINKAGKLTMDNCMISWNQAGGTSGAGGGIYGGYALPEESDVTAILQDTVFWGNTSGTSGNGGGVRLEYCDLVMSGCRFNDNYSGNYGGGLAFLSETPAKITDCEFDNNTAKSSGGGAYLSVFDLALENCVFKNNKTVNTDAAKTTGGAGARINADGGADAGVGITGCDFISNVSMNHAGGLMILSGTSGAPGQSAVTVSGCGFKNNAGLNHGGGLYFGLGSKLEIAGSSFIGNSAVDNYHGGQGNGGGVYIAGGGVYKLINSCFINNIARREGGGISAWGGAQAPTGAVLSAVNCLFYGNTVNDGGEPGYGGGGIYAYFLSKVNIVSCTFTQNYIKITLTSHGSSIYQNDGELKIYGSLFSKNYYYDSVKEMKEQADSYGIAILSFDAWDGTPFTEKPFNYTENFKNSLFSDSGHDIFANVSDGAPVLDESSGCPALPVKGGGLAHNKISAADIDVWGLASAGITIPDKDPAGNIRNFAGAQDIGAFEVNKLKVVYKSDQSDYLTEQREEGTRAEKPLAPGKTGHTFAGWYNNEDCSDEFDFDSLISTDKTFYAKWTVNSYNVIFDTNGGKPADRLSIEYKNTCPAPAPPVRKGYAFAGWYADKNLQIPFDFDNSVITEDITLYAKWHKLPFPAYATALIVTGGVILLLALVAFAIIKAGKSRPAYRAAADVAADTGIGSNASAATSAAPDIRLENGEKADALLKTLTLREREISVLLLEGLTLRQISGYLGISYDTVHSHYKNIYLKLEVSSRAELLIKYKKS